MLMPSHICVFCSPATLQGCLIPWWQQMCPCDKGRKWITKGACGWCHHQQELVPLLQTPQCLWCQHSPSHTTLTHPDLHSWLITETAWEGFGRCLEILKTQIWELSEKQVAEFSSYSMGRKVLL